MSLYAMIDGKDGGDVATNTGWAEFVAWVETLSGVDDVRHLTEYGWTELCTEDCFRDQLTEALEVDPPSPDVADIAQGLLDMTDGADEGAILTVSDGSGVGGSEAEDEMAKSYP